MQRGVKMEINACDIIEIEEILRPQGCHFTEEGKEFLRCNESKEVLACPGSGKTTLGRILAGLERSSRGNIFFKSKDITRLNSKEWRRLHRQVQIIFQDPFSSLNPRIRVGDAIAEAMLGLPGMDSEKRRKH